MSKLNMSGDKVPTVSDWKKLINEEEIKKIVKRRNETTPYHDVEKTKKAFRFGFHWCTHQDGEYPVIYSEHLEEFKDIHGETYYEYRWNRNEDFVRWIKEQMFR